MNTKASILAVVALTGAVAFAIAGTSLGRDGATGSATNLGRDGTAGSAQRVLHSPGAQVTETPRGASIAATRRGATVRYLESKTTTIGPGASDGYSFTCPKRTPRAVGGYGGTAQAANAGDIVIADSTPFRKGRSWSVGVKNLAAEPREFFVGVVCVG